MPPVDDDRSVASLVGQGQRENYATTANLAKRQALFAFSDPTRSSGRRPIDRIAWTGHERVLDAGCGNGIWLTELRTRFGVRDVVGLDLSRGMLQGARATLGADVSLTVGDVQRLPFGDETMDVVLCFWMLFHVADHQVALEECKRVLRPGGRLLAVTNTEAPRALDQVVGTALSAVTGERRDRWGPSPSFSAENGASIVGRVFDRVEAEPFVSAFALPTPEPALGAIESTRGPIEVFLGQRIDWEVVEREAERLIEETIARDGVFRTEIRSTSFLAHK